MAMLAGGLITVLLWGYALQGDEAKSQREVAAAVLLIVPAVLTALAIRPREHPLAARVLAIVRLLVLSTGVLASAAAAALAGVRPATWTVEEAFKWYAEASVLPFSLLVISWVVAFPSAYTLRRRLASSWLAPLFVTAVAATLSGALLVWAGQEPTWAEEHRDHAASTLAVWTCASLYWLRRAFWFPTWSVRYLTRMASLALAVLYAGAAVGAVAWGDMKLVEGLEEAGIGALVMGCCVLVATLLVKAAQTPTSNVGPVRTIATAAA
jgi:hypothetical protein